MQVGRLVCRAFLWVSDVAMSRCGGIMTKAGHQEVFLRELMQNNKNISKFDKIILTNGSNGSILQLRDI